MSIYKKSRIEGTFIRLNFDAQHGCFTNALIVQNYPTLCSFGTDYAETTPMLAALSNNIDRKELIDSTAEEFNAQYGIVQNILNQRKKDDNTNK
jgi:hypothetical protein